MSPNINQVSSTVKRVARIQFTKNPKCQGFDLYHEPIDIVWCLEDGYQNLRDVFDYGECKLEMKYCNVS